MAASKSDVAEIVDPAIARIKNVIELIVTRKWFSNAIIYSLDVDTFFDSNEDGIGDFKGLTAKLDYLSGLGVTCLWLLPFFPSPNRDNGYDIEDYYGIDGRLGDPGDFVHFMSRCKELGMRVIIDLVINHTSVDHPWFQQARKDRDSPFRDFYVWKDKPEPYEKAKLMFHGEEESIWTYDEKAGQYYLHRFYKEQPDLNISCPALRNELLKIIEFWLVMRVDGFRIDAAEMLIESYGIDRSSKKSLEGFLEEIRSFAESRNPDVLLLAEANIPPNKAGIYIKGDSRMNMLFNFYVNQHLFVALSNGDASIITKSYRKITERGSPQLLNFLRHHDELSLALLSDKEVERVLSSFAPEEDMRIYKRGIRRRLAPMVNNNMSVLQMLYSFLFSMPGAALLRYGDEIGMGDNLLLNGRTSVRTPMQWSSAKHGGFSKTTHKKLVHPVINKGEFAFQKVNVLTQQSDPDSLLNFIERLITTRRQTSELAAGTYQFLKGFSKRVLVHLCKTETATILFIHNFSEEVFTVKVNDLVKTEQRFAMVLRDANSIFDTGLLILAPYGFAWFRAE
jgi:maltose alpha-D-glucosyltransferase/alpha-amylase